MFVSFMYSLIIYFLAMIFFNSFLVWAVVFDLKTLIFRKVYNYIKYNFLHHILIQLFLLIIVKYRNQLYFYLCHKYLINFINLTLIDLTLKSILIYLLKDTIKITNKKQKFTIFFNKIILVLIYILKITTLWIHNLVKEN